MESVAFCYSYRDNSQQKLNQSANLTCRSLLYVVEILEVCGSTPLWPVVTHNALVFMFEEMFTCSFKEAEFLFQSHALLNYVM